MQPSKDNLGSQLRKLRKANRESLEVTAKSIKANRSYLNRIELGQAIPSPELLDKILVHFKVEGNDANELRIQAGHVPRVIVVGGRKEADSMQEQTVQQPPQVNMNPMQTPILYTDSVFVSSSDYGVVLDVAQSIAQGQQQTVVARIGMSTDHAKKLIEILHDHIEKNER